jgi:DNA-binding response OmpR family regulator
MRQILIVDHDTRSGVVIGAALGGMRVREAVSGNLALAILNHEAIDLAIVDAFVPGSSTRVAMYAIDRGIPVLMTTSDRDLLDRFRELKIPCIAKPLTVARVHTEVSAVRNEVEKTLNRSREGLARLPAGQMTASTTLRDARALVAQSFETRPRMRGYAPQQGDLRALADSYRGLALCGSPLARASRLRMAGQLDRWAAKREWMTDQSVS